MTETNIR